MTEGSLYTIDALWPHAHGTDAYDALVTVVGLGGTGAFLAEDLSRLLSVHLRWRVRLALVDMDRVEEHNARRQAFTRRDQGRYKASVVGDRLARQFPVEVRVSLAPYDPQREAPCPDDGERWPRLALLVGCVDNAPARRELARTLERAPAHGASTIWWLDLGNSAASGQLYLGNAPTPEALKGAFDPETRVCSALPAPSMQAPELLVAAQAPLAPPELDCAEAQQVGDQEPFVNRAIAALGLAVIARLCQGKLTWRATYFDLDAGSLRYVHAMPGDVARLAGLPEREIYQQARKRAGRRRRR